MSSDKELLKQAQLEERRRLKKAMSDFIQPHYFEWKIDRLVYLGEIRSWSDVEAFNEYMKIEMKDYLVNGVDPTRMLWQLVDVEDDKRYGEWEFRMEHTVRVELTAPRNWSVSAYMLRVEFNPRYITETLKTQIRAILERSSNIRLSRIDVAYDIDTSLAGAQFDISQKDGRIRSRSKQNETLTWGAPKSQYFIRLYDKQKERGLNADERVWWRMEFQFNGNGISDFHERVWSNLGKFRIGRDDFDEQVIKSDLKPFHKAMIMLVHEGRADEILNELSRPAKYQIRREMREIEESVGYITSVRDRAMEMFNLQEEQILAEVTSYADAPLSQLMREDRAR